MQSVGYSTSFSGIIDPGDPPRSPPTLFLSLAYLLFFTSSSLPPLLPPRQRRTRLDWLVVSGMGLALWPCSLPSRFQCLSLSPPVSSSFTGASTWWCGRWRWEERKLPDATPAQTITATYAGGAQTPPLSFWFWKCPTPHTRCLVMLFLLSQLQVLMRWDSLYTTELLAGLQQAVLFIYSERPVPLNLNRPMHRSITGECMENKGPPVYLRSAADYLSNPPSTHAHFLWLLCCLYSPCTALPLLSQFISPF